MRFWQDNEKKFKQLINILRDPMTKDKKMEMHTHDFVEIEYVLFGSGIQIINGKEYNVSRGDLIFLKKGDCHTYKTESRLEILNIVFYYSVFDEMCNILHTYTPDISFPTITHISGTDMIYIEDLLLNAEKEFLNEKRGYYHILKSTLTTLLIYLWRITSEPQSKANYKLTIIMEYIDTNYSSINIHDVADHFGYSDDYFSSLFKKSFGVSFVEYVNKKRMNQAVELLVTTDMTVEAICETVGFKDKKHFYNIFKRYVGTTPAALRKKQGENFLTE